MSLLTPAARTVCAAWCLQKTNRRGVSQFCKKSIDKINNGEKSSCFADDSLSLQGF